MTTGKTIASARQIFFGKVTSVLVYIFHFHMYFYIFYFHYIGSSVIKNIPAMQEM